MVTAQIVLHGASVAYDKKYTYAVSEELLSKAKAGCRVTVPFGRSNIKKQGMILNISRSDDKKLKFISEVIDEKPVLNDESLKMCEWMKEHTFCTYFDAIHAILPTGLTYKFVDYYTANGEFCTGLLSESERQVYDFILSNGHADIKRLKKAYPDAEKTAESLVLKEALFKNSEPKRKMGDPMRKYVRLNADFDNSSPLTQRQKEIIEVLETVGSASLKEIQYFTGVSASVIAALEKKGAVTVFEKEEPRYSFKENKNGDRSPIKLTDEQNKAFSGLEGLLNDNKPHTALLYGVTGSGKTQVFLKLADSALKAEKSVIIMVPEIALTPQIINIFSSRYGSKTAVFHSAMSLGRRMEEYNRIKSGEAKIAIGTRSAVFAPAENLGLIIIDEEQEHTYKSEQAPKFHARELAGFRAKYNNALLCLASATPSLETYSNALNGSYEMFTLKNRYGGSVLPETEVVDMKKEILNGNSSALSMELTQAIDGELSKNKQVILLLNRRGRNTYISCPNCGWVAACPNCSVTLTYHSANGRLMCHYCGYSERVTGKCPQCGGENVRFMGVGTQKIEEELKMLFGNAKILRLDADSTSARESYSEYLTEFAEHKYDIMIGTQMVAKGLDFPNVSLVGVIGADMAMYSEDYRGFERTFSLITQVVGRAGRNGGSGRAIIQTTDPKSEVIELAKRQDYEAFYNSEIMTRRLMIYPPFCTICQVAVISDNADLAHDAIKKIFDNITLLVNKDSGTYKDIKLIILGPAPACVFKVNNKYRYRMIIKCKNTAKFREMLKIASDIRLSGNMTVSIDIDPETIL